MKKTKRFLFIAIAICISMIMLSSQSNLVRATTNDDVPTIIVGSTKSISSISIFSANQSKYFNKNGVNVEIKLYDSTSDLNTAINNKEIDGAVTNLVNYASIVNKNDWKIGSTMPGYYGLVSSKKVKHVRELKNKIVAVNRNDQSGYYLSKILKNGKLKYSNIKVKQIDSEADRVKALKNKKVDAAVLTDPSISNAKANGAHILKKESLSKDNGDILIFSAKFLKKNKSATNIFYSSVKQSVKDMNNNGYVLINSALDEYGVNNKSIGYLNNMDVTMRKPHKVKSSSLKKSFKYAKSRNIFHGKLKSSKYYYYKIKQVEK